MPHIFLEKNQHFLQSDPESKDPVDLGGSDKNMMTLAITLSFHLRWKSVSSLICWTGWNLYALVLMPSRVAVEGSSAWTVPGTGK